MSPVNITISNVSRYFYLEQFSSQSNIKDFSCHIDEYTEYLLNDALCSLNDHIAKTWLLCEKSSGSIAAYMSLVADAIKLSFTEKELHGLNYPFKTIPAVKIAKLAVDKTTIQKYKGIGSFMIQAAAQLMYGLNKDYIAARFLTVDADIEHNKGVLGFYEKNGFTLNTELNKKNQKTISMRKDIWKI